jgi:pimeloyl-ACP methyl ester carboxylesterase
VYDYDHSPNAEKTATSFDAVDVEEYTLLEKLHLVTSVMDTWHTLYPRMQSIDLRTDVRQLQLPAYFVQGAHEMRGLAELFTPWYEALQAPEKHLAVFDTSGHRPMFEQPDRFVEIMRRVKAETA